MVSTSLEESTVCKDDNSLDLLFDAAPEVETLSFYSGTVVLEYVESEHCYTRVLRDGARAIVPSSTTICGLLDKSAALIQWSSNETVAYILQELPALEH